jgi:hypothetical protein
MTSNRFTQDVESKLFYEQLPFIISLPATVRIGAMQAPTKLAGHTRCISATELQLIGPFTLFSNRFSFGKNQPFQMLLGLPTGAIRLHAEAVSFTQLDENEANMGYLITAQQDTPRSAPDMNCVIKARITDINDNDYQQLVKYLRTLNRKELEQTVLVMESDGSWREQTLTVTVLA